MLDVFQRFVESEQYKALCSVKFEDRKVVTMDQFDIYRFLGAGGFGMVLLAKKADTKRYYAIKALDKRILHLAPCPLLVPCTVYRVVALSWRLTWCKLSVA